jgi:hypothetical protein
MFYSCVNAPFTKIPDSAILFSVGGQIIPDECFFGREKVNPGPYRASFQAAERYSLRE